MRMTSLRCSQLMYSTGMADHSSMHRAPPLHLCLLIRYYKLLASPTFHRAVQNVHRKVRHLRHGPDLEEMGPTNIDSKPCRRGTCGTAC